MYFIHYIMPLHIVKGNANKKKPLLLFKKLTACDPNKKK